MTLPVGLDVPFRLLSGKSSPNVVEGDDALDRSIRSIILTFPGERPYRPAFGTIASAGIHSNMTEATAVQIANSVREAIKTWEPRVSVKDISFELDDNTIKFTVTWAPSGRGDDNSTVIEFGV